MRPKRPLVTLPKREKQSSTQLRDFMASRTLRPNKARTFWVGTIADMPERQDKWGILVDHLTKLLDGFRN